jgi:hypothetical protein
MERISGGAWVARRGTSVGGARDWLRKVDCTCGAESSMMKRPALSSGSCLMDGGE